MQKINFIKMSGAGNDFVVIDKKFNENLFIDEKFVKSVCNRRNGIGADGLFTIEDSKDYNFVMNYFNADGSTGSLCANGARCAIFYASETARLNNDKADFLSNDVHYSGEVVSHEEVRFFLNAPKKIKYNFKIKANAKFLNAHYADTGSPHVVIDLAENENLGAALGDLPVESLGKEIRYLEEFQPGGTNVNFTYVKDSKLHIRTYERGVEAETLACGTGSVASALICYVNHKLTVPIEIIPKSNEKLFVNFEVENSKVKNLSLTGPAKVVFTGEMKI